MKDNIKGVIKKTMAKSEQVDFQFWKSVVQINIQDSFKDNSTYVVLGKAQADMRYKEVQLILI